MATNMKVVRAGGAGGAVPPSGKFADGPSPCYGRVLFAYEAQAPTELPLQEDEVIEIINKDPGGWWEGRSCTTGEVGYFPGNFVEDLSAAPPLPSAGLVKMSAATARPPASQTVTIPIPEHGPIKNATSGARGVKPKTGFEDFVSSQTRYGMMATNMASGCGAGLILAGVANLLLFAMSPVFLGINELVLNVYAIIVGTLTILFERRWLIRTNAVIPIRAFMYTLMVVPLLFTNLTYVFVPFYFIVAFFNCISAFKEEQFLQEHLLVDPPSGPALPRAPFMKRWEGAWTRAKENGDVGSYTFIFIYSLINIFVAVWAFIVWLDIVQTLANTRLALSIFAPFAKLFGNLLDLNCGFILLPVCRTFIRYLYDLSTQSQAWTQRLMRMILTVIPLDKAIVFHKRIAGLILIFAFGHTFFHLLNYGVATRSTVETFGLWPWISGVIIFAIMLVMYGATFPNVKHYHFELFWKSHQLFILFFAFLLSHGRGGINPNVWKWLCLPMAIYIAERIYRRHSAYRSVALTSVNNMGKVLCVQFDRDSAFPQGYKEGQYLFLNCPHVSGGQWHPFTISSAPQEPNVSVHMRVMGADSWTGKVSEYLQLMMPLNKSNVSFVTSVCKGKVMGPDGKQIFRVYGPHSAPTQHISEYQVDMIIGAGIGVTPVSATIRSIVHHRWKFAIGTAFPEHAYFFWVVAHSELDSFRWFVRVLKDADDAVYNASVKNAAEMKNKTFEVHVFVTSAPSIKAPFVKPIGVDDVAFWGDHQDNNANVAKLAAPWNEEDLFKTLKSPPEGCVMHGSVYVYNGRPQWDARFEEVAYRHAGKNIGVAYCGNPRIAKDLKTTCKKWSSTTSSTFFNLHKENF